MKKVLICGICLIAALLFVSIGIWFKFNNESKADMLSLVELDSKEKHMMNFWTDAFGRFVVKSINNNAINIKCIKYNIEEEEILLDVFYDPVSKDNTIMEVGLIEKDGVIISNLEIGGTEQQDNKQKYDMIDYIEEEYLNDNYFVTTISPENLFIPNAKKNVLMAVVVQQKRSNYGGSWFDIFAQWEKNKKTDENYPCVYLWTLQFSGEGGL